MQNSHCAQTPSLAIGPRAVDDTGKFTCVHFRLKTGKPLVFAYAKMDFTLSCKQKYCYTSLTEDKNIKFKISKNLVFLLELNTLGLVFAHNISSICLIHIIVPFTKT